MVVVGDFHCGGWCWWRGWWPMFQARWCVEGSGGCGVICAFLTDLLYFCYLCITPDTPILHLDIHSSSCCVFFTFLRLPSFPPHLLTPPPSPPPPFRLSVTRPLEGTLNLSPVCLLFFPTFFSLPPNRAHSPQFHPFPVNCSFFKPFHFYTLSLRRFTSPPLPYTLPSTASIFLSLPSPLFREMR